MDNLASSTFVFSVFFPQFIFGGCNKKTVHLMSEKSRKIGNGGYFYSLLFKATNGRTDIKHEKGKKLVRLEQPAINGDGPDPDIFPIPAVGLQHCEPF